MKIAIASDHRGFNLKVKILAELNEKYDITDLGTYSSDQADYTKYAFKLGEAVASHEFDKGILICGSGIGISIAANKVKGIRCGMGYNDEVSKLMVEHNHANMIAFGAKFMSAEEIYKRIIIFLETKPSEEERHVRRVKQIVEQ